MRRRVGSTVRRAALPVAGLTVLLAGWWSAVVGFGIEPFLLPGPPRVVDAFVRHGDYLAVEAGRTLGHTLGGFGIAAAAGVLTAALLAGSRLTREMFLPTLVALQAVPKVAVAPLMIIWLGFGAASKVALVALLCFFPVLVATLTGLRSTPADLVELMRSLSASAWQTQWRVRFPYAVPHIFAGLRVAVSLALIGAVVAQITTPNAGLGAVIVRSGQSADTALAFAAIAVLAGLGIGLYYLLVGLERILVPWAGADG
jgi:NitT/TauT family transport system permease protein